MDISDEAKLSRDNQRLMDAILLKEFSDLQQHHHDMKQEMEIALPTIFEKYSPRRGEWGNFAYKALKRVCSAYLRKLGRVGVDIQQIADRQEQQARQSDPDGNPLVGVGRGSRSWKDAYRTDPRNITRYKKNGFKRRVPGATGAPTKILYTIVHQTADHARERGNCWPDEWDYGDKFDFYSKEYIDFYNTWRRWGFVHGLNRAMVEAWVKRRAFKNFKVFEKREITEGKEHFGPGFVVEVSYYTKRSSSVPLSEAEVERMFPGLDPEMVKVAQVMSEYECFADTNNGVRRGTWELIAEKLGGKPNTWSQKWFRAKAKITASRR